MSDSTKEMLRQLRSSLKELDKVKKMHSKVLDDQIGKLPDDKKKQAIDLVKKARNGKLDLGEMMAFTSDLESANKQKINKSVKRANAKKKEVTGK